MLTFVMFFQQGCSLQGLPQRSEGTKLERTSPSVKNGIVLSSTIPR